MTNAAPPPAGTTSTEVPPAAAAAARAAMPAPMDPNLGRLSKNHTCQYCSHQGPTVVKEKMGTCALIGLIVLLLCFWPLFWLPLIMPSCKDKEHMCSNCQRKVGESEGSCDTCCKPETT